MASYVQYLRAAMPDMTVGQVIGTTLVTISSIWWKCVDRILWCVDIYRYLDSFTDEKIQNYPLMGSPLGPVAVLVLYFVAVHQGYQWMISPSSPSPSRSGPRAHSTLTHHHHHQHHHHHHHHHKPSSRHRDHHNFLLHQIPILTKQLFPLVLVVYNCAMAALNAWISYELLHCGLRLNYNFLCQLVYPGVDDPYENRIATAIWWYFASKGIELLDTMWIIAKRKHNQLSFLHIYHHSTMFAVWWVGAKFVPGGSALSGALVNCLVHVLMYTYYALAACGPRVQPFLWWKKYLTIIQLVQFTAGVSLGLNSIISGCAFTRWMQYVFVCYAFSFLVLFGNFYRKTYATSKRGKKSKPDPLPSPTAQTPSTLTSDDSTTPNSPFTSPKELGQSGQFGSTSRLKRKKAVRRYQFQQQQQQKQAAQGGKRKASAKKSSKTS